LVTKQQILENVAILQKLKNTIGIHAVFLNKGVNQQKALGKSTQRIECR
jgi:hypothetical protein